MHPDLVRDADGRVHAEAFMKRLNEAYRAVDAERIRDLLLQWNASPYAPPVAAAGELRGLEAAVARAEQRLAQERASEMARIMEQAMASAAEGRDLLAEMRTAAQTQLTGCRARWEALSSEAAQDSAT
jgi:NAD(P)H-nitrite reductase large subunit